MSKLSAAQLDDIRARHPCYVVASRWVALRKKGNGYIGPCPLHSPDPQARDSTAFECDAEGWKCAVCAKGGDVIKLVQEREGLDFRAAIEVLGGPQKGEARLDEKPIDPEQVRRAAEAQARRQAERAAETAQWRERARGWAWERWERGRDFAGSAGEAYLRRRLGGAAPPPLAASLRFDPAARYYVEDRDGRGKKEFRLVHTGPAVLCAIARGGKFLGLHRTFIDLDRPPKFKAAIVDGKTGAALASKTMHGGKKGGHIALYGADAPAVLILGEGLEKVAAVWAALGEGGRDLTRAAAWSAGDLGNLGGKALGTVPHPSLKTPTGRAGRVPGPLPDLAAPAIEIPPSVTRLVLLGDSTSDDFATRCTLARAAARFRHARDDLDVVAAWAPAGQDFDDLLRLAAPAPEAREP